MKQLYSARNGFEAHEVRLFLESQGIEVKVFGDNNALESGFAFTPASAPGVFVNEADFDRAASLLENFQTEDHTPIAAGTWACPNCGETVDVQFDICWNCESPRRDAPIQGPVADEPKTVCPPNPNTSGIEVAAPKIDPAVDDDQTQSKREIWLEVLVVLAVSWLPYFSYSVLSWIWPDPSSDWSYAAENLWQIINSIVICVVVLYVIYRGHSPWSAHGIKKPRILADPGSALLIWIAMITAVAFVYGLAASIVGAVETDDMATSAYEFARPITTADFFVLAMLALSIGFSEELAMRAYLIPRFEQLLGSTPKSILLSTMIFASYHLYQGIGAAMMIGIMGLVFGIAFCWSRRLWPVAIAHALTDFFALS